MNQSQKRAGSKGRTGKKKPSAKKQALRKADGRSFMGGNRKTARSGSGARTGRGGRAGKASGGRPVLKLIVGFLIVAAFIAATGYVVYADRYESHFIEGTRPVMSSMRTATRAILLKVRSSITMMSAD